MMNPQIQGIEVQDEEIQQEEIETIIQDPKQQESIINRDDYKLSYLEAVKKREEIYKHTLQRMYEKIQNPPLFAKLKKKHPIINITTKNKITKGNGNGKIDPEEHRLRVYNREMYLQCQNQLFHHLLLKKTKWLKTFQCIWYLSSLIQIIIERIHSSIQRVQKQSISKIGLKYTSKEEIESLPNQLFFYFSFNNNFVIFINLFFYL